MKKAGIITKWLKVNGKKFSDAAEILDFKSENGFRDAINHGTLTPIRTVRLAELVGKSHASLVNFLTDGALASDQCNEPKAEYCKSISKAKDPHELAELLFSRKAELDELTSRIEEIKAVLDARNNGKNQEHG